MTTRSVCAAATWRAFFSPSSLDNTFLTGGRSCFPPSLQLPALRSGKRWTFVYSRSFCSSSFSSSTPIGTTGWSRRVGSATSTTIAPTRLETSTTSLPSPHGSLLTSSDWTSSRVEKIQTLADDIFSRGNIHLKNVKHLTALPEGLHSFPEVCFIGKPNVGKSSIISCVLHNGVLGRGGKHPGTTRLLKFFNVGDAIALVDTPGYGGWKTKKGTPTRRRQRLPAERAQAFAILFRYLSLRHRGQGLKRVYWVMEANAGLSRMSFQARDEEILSFLQREGIPFSIILSKIDRHWRYCREHHSPERKNVKNQFVVDKEGIPQIPWRSPAFPPFFHQNSTPIGRKGGGISEEDPSHQNPVSLFQEGVRRNMMEIIEFLGTNQIPILGVSANRFRPERCLYIDALRYDLTYHCVADLPEASWNYKTVHALSYAPPTANDLQEVQLTYPVESFVVPNDNTLSLAEMVQRHQAGKAKLLERRRGRFAPYHASFSLPPSVDPCVLSSGDGSERGENKEACSERPGGLLAAGPGTTEIEERDPSSSVGFYALPASSSFGGGSRAAHSLERIEEGTTALVPLHDLRRTEEEARGIQDTLTVNRTTVGGLRRLPSPPGVPSSFIPLPTADKKDLFLATMDKAVSVLQEKHGACGGGRGVTSPSRIPSSSTFFTAINGVSIPSTLVPSCVEEALKTDSDELHRFAMHSGAGSFDALLAEEHMGDMDPGRCTAFLEHTTGAKIQAGLEANPSGKQDYLFYTGGAGVSCSEKQRTARKKREEALLKKYVDRRRKERSVYLSAEGYMCPWLSVSGGMGGPRSAVVGVESVRGSGGSGALMKDLKRKGFGGKSYSACTMKHRGRATKKTGFWAT